MTTVVHSARLVGDVEGDSTVDDHDAWIAFRDGVVTARGTGDSWKDLAGDALDARDTAGPGAVLTPGFVDIHSHGGGGAGYDTIADSGGAAAAREAIDMHATHGTTRVVVSLVAAPVAALIERLRAIADLTRSHPGVLGAHLEGPFLAPSRRGAHDEEFLIAPRPEVLDDLVTAAGGALRQVTIAPELPGALAAISRLTAEGVAVAIGHTTADAQLAAAAFDAGATILTHAYNAMPGIGHRDPGPIGAATADDRVTLEVIADGVHVHPEPLRILFAAAVGRVALVTDAMAAAGARDGEYRLGDAVVTVSDGIAHLSDGTIAGSTLTQDRAMRQALAAGVPLTDTVRALTSIPARAVGREDLGTFAVGARADGVLMSASGDVHAVWRDGGRLV